MGIKEKRIHMGTPRPRWGGDTPIYCLERSDREHTPDNKRPGQVHYSRCDFRVTRFHGSQDANVSFEMTETTQAKEGGPMQTRVIGMSMPQADAEAFARFILEGK